MPSQSEHRLAPVTGRFGQNLRRIREDRGLSQEALAEHADIHRTEAGLLERGGREPEMGTMLKLAAALEVPLDEFVKGIEWQIPEQASDEGYFRVAGPA